MKTIFSIAQVDILTGQPELNLAKAEQLVAQAADQDSQLILFPELWSTGYALEQAKELCAQYQNMIQDRISHLARQHNLWIGGTHLELADDHLYNTFTLHNSQGDLTAAYRKIHLFKPMQEGKYLTPGQQPVLVPSPWGMTGLATCYDLRFPELFRWYSRKGVEVILLPAQWPAVRANHWDLLVRVRAIENQCVIVAANRVSPTPDGAFVGHSLVIGPWGEELAIGSASEELITVAVDLESIGTARNKLPVLTDRRVDLFFE